MIGQQKITTLFLILISLSWSKGQAQKTNSANEKLAVQYYESKEYEKANAYLEVLYDKDPNNWYPYYFKSLLGVKDYDRAQKITRKQIKSNKYNVYLYVNSGLIYQLENETKKEKECYEKAIKELVPIQPYILNLATSFIEAQLYDYALQVYNKARKASPDYPYFYERAEIYKLKNDPLAMINEYLDALDFRESDLESVQVNLQNSLGYDDDQGGIKNPLLKQELQKRIQKSPDKIVFSEFLIFILKQQRDFDAAFVQSKALDKRLKEEGQRLFDLGKICVSNQFWATARKCFDYVIEKGPASPYYDPSVISGINAEYLQLTQNPLVTQIELEKLDAKLNKANNDYKNNSYSDQLIKNLANLRACYLNKPDEGIILIEDHLSNTNLEPTSRADYKLMLGDFYLLKGEIWEASLLYSQVEKDFKYEVIGQEAKFRNAKLSYYAGDFAWAKTQADILKGATSKLIANDALDLSLVITDAIGVDTNAAPLKMFSSADLLVLQHRYKEAISRMDSINLLFSIHTLGDDIYYKKAQIYMTLLKYNDTEEMYKNILEFFPNEIYGDDAQFYLAQLYERNLLDTSKAKQAYEDVMIKYPGSIYTVEARKRFRDLRGDPQRN